MPDPPAILTLSLDTTTRAGSAALTRGDRTLALVVGDPARTHGERLPGDIAALLAAATCAVDDVGLYAVAAGPGSFTGLRVGIAAVQGLALATGRKVVPVSSLDALSACDAAAANGPELTAAWIDAQRGQIFGALYRGRGRLSAPVALPPEQVLKLWIAERPTLATDPPLFVGDGAMRYRDVIRATLPAATIVEPPPLAPVIGRLAAARLAEAVAPHAIVPVYVRAPDAELARDRSRAAAPRPESS
jgi:tRNA threonylcarbamoyladenosine biosynthesis protein TsaB